MLFRSDMCVREKQRQGNQRAAIHLPLTARLVAPFSLPHAFAGCTSTGRLESGGAAKKARQRHASHIANEWPQRQTKKKGRHGANSGTGLLHHTITFSCSSRRSSKPARLCWHPTRASTLPRFSIPPFILFCSDRSARQPTPD